MCCDHDQIAKKLNRYRFPLAHLALYLLSVLKAFKGTLETFFKASYIKLASHVKKAPKRVLNVFRMLKWSLRQLRGK